MHCCKHVQKRRYLCMSQAKIFWTIFFRNITNMNALLLLLEYMIRFTVLSVDVNKDLGFVFRYIFYSPDSLRFSFIISRKCGLIFPRYSVVDEFSSFSFLHSTYLPSKTSIIFFSFKNLANITLANPFRIFHRLYNMLIQGEHAPGSM